MYRAWSCPACVEWRLQWYNHLCTDERTGHRSRGRARRSERGEGGHLQEGVFLENGKGRVEYPMVGLLNGAGILQGAGDAARGLA